MSTPGTVTTHIDVQRRALLVLGMHRSGTSALTRVLNIYGAALPTDLLPANEHNVTGHWESTAVMNFHNRLLEARGSGWDDPIWLALQPLDADSIHDYAKQLAELITAEYGDASWLAVKDPRMCRFMPIWREALALLNIQPLPILIVRNPFDVAASLRQRDGRPEWSGLLLWLQHVLAAEYNSRELRRAVLFYDRLLTDCPAAIADVEAQLEISFPADRATAQAQAVAFLQPSLRHQHASDAPMRDGSEVSRWVGTTFAWFQRMADGAAPDFSCLDVVRTELTEAERLFESYVQFYKQRAVRADLEAFQWREHAAALESTLRTVVPAPDGSHTEGEAFTNTHAVAVTPQPPPELALIEEMPPAEGPPPSAKSVEIAPRGQVQPPEAHRASVAGVSTELPPQVQQPDSRMANAEKRTNALRRLLNRARRLAYHGQRPGLMVEKALRFQRAHGTRRLIVESIARLKAWGTGDANAFPPIAIDDSGCINVREFVRHEQSATSPLRLFTVLQNGVGRVSMVTDSINRGSLYGGVGTAMILAALLAEARRGRLRIITRVERPQPSGLEGVLKTYGIELSSEVEFAYAPFYDHAYELDRASDELFVTTSWWTTASTLGVVPAQSILYLLQEDERMFYPYGHERLRCSQVLQNPDLRVLVNTKMLFEHLASSGLAHLTSRGMWFEPAFPPSVFHPRRSAEVRKRVLMLYSRPNNLRNLFSFGLELLETALSRGILDLDSWDIVLVGKDIPELRFDDGRYSPTKMELLSWPGYVDLVGQVDLGVCLMYTPHPSYPPFDLAASGAVVVTNTYGPKQSLDSYSKNIVCGDLTIPSMLEALQKGLRLACSVQERDANFRANRFVTDWRASFAHVLRRYGMPN